MPRLRQNESRVTLLTRERDEKLHCLPDRSGRERGKFRIGAPEIIFDGNRTNAHKCAHTGVCSGPAEDLDRASAVQRKIGNGHKGLDFRDLLSFRGTPTPSGSVEISWTRSAEGSAEELQKDPPSNVPAGLWRLIRQKFQGEVAETGFPFD